MSLPSAETVLNKTARDPGAPSGLRYRALNKLAKPQKATLVKILRDCKASAKLRALASLKYAEAMERKGKKETAKAKMATIVPDVMSINGLGLKV